MGRVVYPQAMRSWSLFYKGLPAYERGLFCLARFPVVVGAVALLASGCGMRMPVGASLGPPTPQPSTVNSSIWVAPVEVHDPDVPNRDTLAESFTTSLHDYLTGGRYFAKVLSLQGNVGANDLILRLAFDRYQLRRSIHPLNIPMGLLTLGIYYISAGPVAVDRWDLAASLTIEDASGKALATVTKAIQPKRNVSIYSKEYLAPGGIRERTDLMAEILADAMRKLDENRAMP